MKNGIFFQQKFPSYNLRSYAMHETPVLVTKASASRPGEAFFPGGLGAVSDSITYNGSLRITAFGRFYQGEEQDWSFRHYKQIEDNGKDTSITRHLPTIAAAMGIREILAP